ncbi:MAG: hypothetical protein CMM02_04355 [Rhodopirellula sp.]|nr:hypothetical protein [Rhodopirellula sp.]
MKICSINYFDNQMVDSLKKLFFMMILLIAGSIYMESAVKKDQQPMPKFDGIKTVVLDNGALVHPKHLLVRLKEEDEIKNISLVGDFLIKKEFNLVDGLVLIEVNHNGIDANDELSIKNNLLAIREDIISTQKVQYVDYDFINVLDKSPTDRAYVDGELWGLHNLGEFGGKIDADIDAPEAWNLTTGSHEVIVGVMDSGLRVTHQDIKNQLWINEDEIPNNGRDDDKDGYTDNINGIAPMTLNGDLTDNVSHGTHVAGTIGASANDNGKHVGVAWNVKIMGIKVGEWWISTGATIAGIEFASNHGVSVINCSFGGYNYSQAEFDAYAAGGEAGIMFATSSGNDGLDVDVLDHYPSSYDLECIISVGASDRNDEQANFSNYGFRGVDLVAPGVDILSLSSSSDVAYDYSSGTSMASPHVSGVMALMRSLQPNWSNLEIREQLFSSVDVLPALDGYVETSGRVNAFNAVDGMSSKVADGKMEISIMPPSGSMLLADTDQNFFVTVIDGKPVENATVIGIQDDGNNLYFNNDGDAPDALKKDNIYSYYLKTPKEAGKMKITILVDAPGKKELVRVVNYEIVPDPLNDDFSNASKLSADGELIEAFNNFATIEPGEPSHSQVNTFAGSLWWNWSPSESGLAIVDLSGSDISGLVSVYYGSEFENLSVLTANYQIDGKSEKYVHFNAIKGKTYRIAVAGDNEDDVGYIRLRAEVGGIIDENPPYLTINNPPNGLVTSEERVEISGIATDPDPSASGVRDIQVRVNGKFSLEAIGAEEWSIPLLLSEGVNTIEVIATDYADNISKPVIWEIDYQAPDVPNDHFGNSEQMNRDVVIADGITNQILLSQDVKNQNDLYIEINGITLGQESYDLDSLSNKKITINKTPAKGSEINIFYNDWLSELVDTEKATKETNEPDHAGNEGGASVWWTFTAPYDGILCVKTTNTKIDTIMGLYQGERLGNLLMLQSNDDDQSLVNLEENPGLSRIDQALTKGSTVRIAVDGFGGLKGGLGISSVFTQQEVYKLTINEGQNGSLKLPSLPFKDVSGNNFGLYARNTEIEVIAIADEGYNFSGWSGSVNSLDNPIKIVVTKDTDLKANFSSRSLSDDFESGSLARLPWLTDISSGWIVQNELSLDGDFALKSGEIGDGQESEITVSVDSNNGKGSFYVKLDSEINWDKLLFLIDGRVVETWSGNVEWNKYEFNLSQGSHELKWIYKKDFANSVGADSAWIDNIKLPLSLKASVGLVSSESGHKVRVWGVSGHRYNIQVSNDLITWKPFDSVIIGAGGITEGKAVINTKEGAAYFRAVAP